MANVAHAILTGSNQHEPKGVESASAGQAYIANGLGSGAWTTVTGLDFTGMISDFTTPLAPDGWLECDGADISTTTFANLYNKMTIQRTGTRSSGVAIISGLSSTTGMKPGYYVFGAGIASGTTILTVDSSSQITMSGNASSSGTTTVIVSPWLLNTGTIRLPNLTTVGKFRRSRTSSLQMGVSQVSQNLSHTHPGSQTELAGNHIHTGTADAVGNHQHNIPHGLTTCVAGAGPTIMTASGAFGILTDGAGNHNHTLTINVAGDHVHNFTTSSSGDAEARPEAVVFMTCVKY